MLIIVVGVGMENQEKPRIISSGSEPLWEYYNMLAYATGSTVILRCNTANLPGSYSPNNYAYSWMTNCNNCFPYGRMTENVSVEALTLCDSGTFTCSARIGDQIYTSNSFALYVQCKW